MCVYFCVFCVFILYSIASLKHALGLPHLWVLHSMIQLTASRNTFLSYLFFFLLQVLTQRVCVQGCSSCGEGELWFSIRTVSFCRRELAIPQHSSVQKALQPVLPSWMQRTSAIFISDSEMLPGLLFLQLNVFVVSCEVTNCLFFSSYKTPLRLVKNCITYLNNFEWYTDLLGSCED